MEQEVRVLGRVGVVTGRVAGATAGQRSREARAFVEEVEGRGQDVLGLGDGGQVELVPLFVLGGPWSDGRDY